MLVLTRKIREKIVISTDIIVTVLNIDGDQVKLGIQAPQDVSIHRQEIYDQILKSNREALMQRKDKDEIFLSVAVEEIKGRRQ
ncbi:MAG: carbon storage regulator CsrA [Candidatus Krumholzibacteriota bacterium]|nr:carbon storage regulator CsrA [Candidatus Krumholzibacteriota bacterium]